MAHSFANVFRKSPKPLSKRIEKSAYMHCQLAQMCISLYEYISSINGEHWRYNSNVVFHTLVEGLRPTMTKKYGKNAPFNHRHSSTISQKDCILGIPVFRELVNGKIDVYLWRSLPIVASRFNCLVSCVAILWSENVLSKDIFRCMLLRIM